MKIRGFTIVELLVVIVVIGILAAITVVTYSGIQARATHARVTSELASINKMLQIYYAENGSYPFSAPSNGAGWQFSCEVGPGNFIPELQTIGTVPDAPCKFSLSQSDTWLYGSNGVDYKLLHLRPSAPIADYVPPDRRDYRFENSLGIRGTWGYWTEGYRTR